MRQNKNTTSDWKERENYFSTSRVRWAKLHCVPVHPMVFVQLSADISRLDFYVCSNFFCAIPDFCCRCVRCWCWCVRKHRVNRSAYVPTCLLLRETANECIENMGFLLFGTYDAGPNRFRNCKSSLPSQHQPPVAFNCVENKWINLTCFFFFIESTRIVGNISSQKFVLIG